MMSGEFCLLPFDKSMLDPCVDLFIDTFSKSPWNDVYDSRNQVVTFFENSWRNNYFIGYVLKKNEEIAALSLGAKKPWLNGMEYYIDQFCVRGTLQGMGIGSAFLRLIEEDIKEKGMNSVILMTDHGFPSEKFYLKNGFKQLENTILLAK